MAALRQAGIAAEVPGDVPGLALTLGGLGMTLEGLMHLYAAIARGGEALALTVLEDADQPRAQLMTPAAAWHVGDILAGAPVPGMYGVEVAAPLLFEVFARLGQRPVAMPPAPPGTLHAANAELPAHLRQFGARLVRTEDAPHLTFPPDGAALEPPAGGILARVERGNGARRDALAAIPSPVAL